MQDIAKRPDGRKQKHRPRRKKSFNFDANRRREVERHAIDVGAFEVDFADLRRWLLAWCWHNPHATDLGWSLANWVWTASRYKRRLTADEVEDVVSDIKVKRTRRCMSADNLARWLGVTYEQRMRLRIRTT